MDLIIPNSASEWLTTILLSLISLSFGIHKLLNYWKSNATESNLIKLMHTELERMSKQNTILSLEVGKLQAELVKLSSQLTDLTIENQKLQAETANLNKEVIRLQEFIKHRELV